jgi:hypothetical protein
MDECFENEYIELTDEDVIIIAREMPYIALTNIYIKGRLNKIHLKTFKKVI